MKGNDNTEVLYTFNSDDGLPKSVIQIAKPNEIISNAHLLVPKWAVVMATTGMITIALITVSAFTVVYHAQRPGLYKESCIKRSCLKELDMKCINNTCQCETGHFYTNKCILKKDYMGKCHLKSYCKDDTDMVCLDGVCKCVESKYWNGKSCVSKTTYGQSCSQDDQCMTNLMLTCDSELKQCLCPAERFWDGTVCTLKRTVNEKCSKDTDCIPSKNLNCVSNKCGCDAKQFWDPTNSECHDRLFENDTCSASYQCYKPMNCTSNTICQCGNKEYHDFSTLTCMPQKTFGEVCSITYNCRVDKYLECKNGICQCIASYPTWSSDRNTCILMSTYSQTCVYQSDCDSTKYLLCNTGTNCTCPLRLSNGKCDCRRELNNEYYWDGSSCAPAVSYNSSCQNASTSYQCMQMTEGTLCRGTSIFYCKCPDLQFYQISSASCQNQRSEGQSCAQTDDCRGDLGLSCQNFECKCNSLVMFWNGTACRNYYLYNNEVCSYNYQCKGLLVCKTSGSSCNCSVNVQNNKCDCPAPVVGTEYYYNGTECVSALSYGQTCSNSSTNYMCKQLTEGTICTGSGSFACKCPTLEYFNQYTSKCESQLLVNQTCPQGDECRVDLGLSCVNRLCQCNYVLNFWNGTACKNYYTYNKETCSSDNECKGLLICKTGASSCNCSVNVQNNKCDCPAPVVGTEYYWNGADCVSAVSFAQSCSNSTTSYMCKQLTEGTICTGSSSFTCQCPALHYFNYGTLKCENQLSINQSCPQEDECRTDLGLNCNVVCECDYSKQFWNGSRCINYFSYNNETCSASTQCKGSLICKTAGTSCNCPSNVANLKCDCPVRAIGSEYYWNGTDCVEAEAYAEFCTAGSNYTCQNLKENTYCSSTGVCSCKANCTFLSGKCKCCAAGWNLINSTCYQIDVSQGHCNAVCGGFTLAILKDPAVKSYFLGIRDHTKDYWFNAIRTGVDSNPFVSGDSTWSVSHPDSSIWCNTEPKNGGKDNAYINANNVCFSSDDCGQNKLAFCQTSPT